MRSLRANRSNVARSSKRRPGIGKFLSRKHESMRRLERTEQNAIRISDLIAELERRIPELETQMRRARRYRRVSTRVRDLEILALPARERDAASRVADAARGDRGEMRSSEAKLRRLPLSLGGELREMRTQLYRCELQLEELARRRRASASDLARLEAQYAAALARSEALERQSTQTSQDCGACGPRARLACCGNRGAGRASRAARRRDRSVARARTRCRGRARAGAREPRRRSSSALREFEAVAAAAFVPAKRNGAYRPRVCAPKRNVWRPKNGPRASAPSRSRSRRAARHIVTAIAGASRSPRRRVARCARTRRGCRTRCVA